MILNLEREDIINLVRGSEPYFDLFGEMYKYGSYDDTRGWRWNYSFHEKLSDKELLEIYNKCKMSWKKEESKPLDIDPIYDLSNYKKYLMSDSTWGIIYIDPNTKEVYNVSNEDYDKIKKSYIDSMEDFDDIMKSKFKKLYNSL